MTGVGYGVTDNGDEYAIIRNSWGANWGEGGYIKVKLTPGESNGGVCQLYKWTNYPLMAV